ncbi:hypothetical protein OG523_01265 [Streptomyces virginiae]|uniref:hypothetical protein n=1 Tax=Streptomyces virginiae TaxID=1961 RepID=UPI002E2FBB37|nr:hypothetical protein [Streptomyces virginiae]
MTSPDGGGGENMMRPGVSPEAGEKQARDLERLRELRASAKQARLAADQAEAALLSASVELL